MGNGISREEMMRQLAAQQNATDARERSQARHFMQLLQAQQSQMAQNQMMMMIMMMMSGGGAGSRPDMGQLMLMNAMMNGGALPFAGGMPRMGGGLPQLMFSTSDSGDDEDTGFPGFGMMKTKK